MTAEKENMKSLYFGEVVNLYYSFTGIKMPKQLDQIAIWLPDLLIEQRDRNKNKEPDYDQNKYIITADRNNGLFYSGGNSNRVTQIVGRLIGTARSNKEKGRKDAELIRRHIAKILVSNFDHIERLQKNTAELLDKIPEDRLDDFHHLLFDYMWNLADSRNDMSDEERNEEPFPFDDYVFDDLIYNVAYQLHLYSYEGLVNAYLWLLLGGFLRNQAGSLTKMFHSGFVAVNRQLSECGTLYDKINYLFNPDEYYSTFSGDDVESKYPDTTWICDNKECSAILNMQEGFDETLSEWICKDCGTVNKIDLTEIYENEEDYQNSKPVDPEDFKQAVKRRKEILEKENN